MYTVVYMYHNFIHSSVDGYLGCFHVLAIVNSAAVNNGMQVSFSFSFFFFFFFFPFSILVSSGYIPRSGIAGTCAGFIPSFF